MSAGSETTASGVTAGDVAVSGGRAGGPSGPPDTAGRLLGRLSVLPVLLVMAWLLAGLPLLLLGRFTPVLTLVVAVPLAAVLVMLGLRWTPARWQNTLPGPGRARQAITSQTPGGISCVESSACDRPIDLLDLLRSGQEPLATDDAVDSSAPEGQRAVHHTLEQRRRNLRTTG